MPNFDSSRQPQATTEATAGWNDWNKASFDGDDAKKNKFLRLLGAKKSTSATATQAFVPATVKKSGGGLYGGLKSAIDEDEKQRISNDLEKQFDHGLQFRKQMQMGRRGGLGFNQSEKQKKSYFFFNIFARAQTSK